MNKEVTPIHLIGTGPQFWQDAIVESPTGLPSPEEFAEIGNLTEWILQEQERTWEDETGVKPEDTHLTVIMPIYNEEKYLQMGLSSVMLSNIPPTADIHFAFVTNKCSDKSEQIVQTFLQSSTDVDEESDEEQITTVLRQVDSASALQGSGRIGNIRFTHINTQTPGKGNALTLGNEMALANNHPLAFCIDANNFVAPDALAHLYRDAHRSLVTEPDGAVVFNGVFDSERKLEGKDIFNSFQEDRTRKAAGKRIHYHVTGALMGWSTEWVRSIGGVPNVAIEDYALSLLAANDGFTTKKVADAVTYGYAANNIYDFFLQKARFTRGRMQIISKYPQLFETIKEGEPYMFGGVSDKVREIKKEINGNPKRIPVAIGLSLYRELVKLKAVMDYRKDPNNPSWESIKSTK